MSCLVFVLVFESESCLVSDWLGTHYLGALSLMPQSLYCLSVPVTPDEHFLYVFQPFGSFPHCPSLTLLYNVGSNHVFEAEALICLVQFLDEHFLQTAVAQSLLPPEPHTSAPSFPFSSTYCSSGPWSLYSLLQPQSLILLSMAAFVLEVSLSSSFGVFLVLFFFLPSVLFFFFRILF